MKQSDAELVKDALQGRQSAFGELVKRYQAMAYGCAYALLGNFDDAEELCQEAFIQAYTSLGNLKEAKKFPSWLRSITRNVCISFIRQKRKLRSFEEAVRKRESPTPAEQCQRRELSSQLMEAVNTLSERNRLLVTLFYLDGLSYKEIGDFLEVPPNTVKVTLRRARQQLKERLLQIVAAQAGSKKPNLEYSFKHALIRDVAISSLLEENKRKYHQKIGEAIERIGDRFSAYCSGDGSNWMTCGEVSLPAEDPIRIGIHAVGSVGLRGGAMATATRFDYFKVLKRKKG